MERAEFKDAMLHGFGRAYIALKTEDKEKFRDIVQWGCLHSLTINVQSDGTLDEYMYRLVSCYDDPEDFLIPLVNAFLPMPFDEDGELFDQYIRLLGQFARHGYRRAEDALLTRYAEFVDAMVQPGFQAKYCVAYEEEYLCELCSMLLDASVERNLLRIATDLGRICENFGPGYPHYDWLYHHLRDMPKDVLLPLAEVHTREVGLFLLDIYACMTQEISFKTYDDGSFGLEEVNRPFKSGFLAPLEARLLEADPHVFDPQPEEADDEDEADEEEPSAEEILSRNKDDVEMGVCDDDDDEYEDDEEEDEKEDEVESRLRSLRNKVNRPYNELLYEKAKDLKKEKNFGDLLACLEHFDKDLSQKAKYIFSRLKHKKARDYALQRIAVEGPDWWTLEPLIYNYRPEDKEFLIKMILHLETNIEEDTPWHLIVQDILAAKCDHDVDLPNEFFHATYELSLCRHCRYEALEVMQKRHAVPEKVQIECYYDGDEDIRAFAEKHRFLKKDY